MVGDFVSAFGYFVVVEHAGEVISARVMDVSCAREHGADLFGAPLVGAPIRSRGRDTDGWKRRMRIGKVLQRARLVGGAAACRLGGVWICLLYTSPSPRDS